jgi:hypothetical protein
MARSSTRLKLMLAGIMVAVLKEVLASNGIELPSDTYLSIQALVLGLMGLDTVRPLGRGYANHADHAPEAAADEAAADEGAAE